MKQLTKDHQLALQDIRKAMCDRLKNFSLTEEMLRDKSLYQLICLIELLVGHYNYVGTFTHTCGTLEEMFGNAMWEKPLVVPDTETESEKANIVN